MTDKEWSILVPQDLSDELSQSFSKGQIIDGQGRRALLEHLVARIPAGKLKVEIFSNDHPPPHFRVKYGDEQANYSIKDCTQQNGDLKKWYLNIKEWHSRNKELLIKVWNETRPSDCPVGYYKE